MNRAGIRVTVATSMVDREVPEASMDKGFSLDDLGIYGFADLTDCIVAGLALGDPMLLVGGPGSAKTTLAELLARALGLQFWAYDASKAMFEDVVGFPDPRSFRKGQVGYLQTPLTIWGKQFVLVDELSRASAGMQNKWLEVIRSRRVMGMPLPDLTYVVAAMNPAGLLGTQPLDDALAGRFTFLLDVPEVHRMGDADRRRVIRNRTADDAVALGPAQERPLPDLKGLLDRVRAAFPKAEASLGDAASTYVDRVGQYLAAKDVLLDGRRLGMMHRALMALAAVHRVNGDLPARPKAPPVTLFRHGLDATLPFRATGRPVARLLVEGAHAFAVAALEGRHRRAMPFANPLAAVRSLLAEPSAWGDADALSLLATRIANAVENPAKVETSLQAGAALCLLAGRPDVLARLQPEARQRLMACWRELAAIGTEEAAEFADQSLSLQVETSLSQAALAGVLRVAFQLARRIDRRPSLNCSFEDFAPKLLATLDEEVPS